VLVGARACRLESGKRFLPKSRQKNISSPNAFDTAVRHDVHSPSGVVVATAVDFQNHPVVAREASTLSDELKNKTKKI
jgi:hypothetical protein